jgi:predicted N-acetyltransferase YhbS
VIVLGHDTYYPRFGFKPASTWGIRPPFDAFDSVFMVMELEISIYAATGCLKLLG